jgi:hypothetical protein
MGFPSLRTVGALALALASGSAQAQQPNVTVSQLDEDTYRHAVTAERRQVVAANIGLPTADLQRFWAVYDEFEKEREPLEKERFAILSRYAQSYAGFSDAQAMALVTASSQIQLSEIQLRAKYAQLLSRKLSGHAGARFFQIDDYVTTAMRMNSLKNVPLVTAPR